MRSGNHLASLLRDVDEDIMDLIKVWLCHGGNCRECVSSRLLQLMLMLEKCFRTQRYTVG